MSTFYPTNYSNQLDTHSCEYFVCLHTFNTSVLSTTYLIKVIWTIKFHKLMDNSLSSKHTIEYFWNELHDFCSMIKHNSNVSISKNDTIRSSSSHENRSISDITNKALIPRDDLRTSDNIPNAFLFLRLYIYFWLWNFIS